MIEKIDKLQIDGIVEMQAEIDGKFSLVGDNIVGDYSYTLDNGIKVKHSGHITSLLSNGISFENGVINSSLKFPETGSSNVVLPINVNSEHTLSTGIEINGYTTYSASNGVVNLDNATQDFLRRNISNVITDDFMLVSGSSEYIFGSDGYFISYLSDLYGYQISDSGFYFTNDGKYYNLDINGLQFNQAKIKVNTNFQTNVNIPITGTTLSTLATAVKYNGVSKFATDNGVIDLGELIVEDDLNGFVYDVTYTSDTHVLTFFRKNLPNVVVDLPIEQLITGVELGGNDLIFTFENGTTTTVPMNTLLVGVVKKVNGKSPNSLGEIILNISDIPDLSSALDSKAGINDQRILNGQIAYDKLSSVQSQLSTVNWYRIAKGTLLSGNGCSFIVIIERTYNINDNESYTFSVNTANDGNTTITQLSGVYNSKLISSIRVVNADTGVVYLDVKYESTYLNYIRVRVFGSAEAIPATIAPTVTTGVTELETTKGVSVLGQGTSAQWNQAYLWGNHANAGYALISQVYTQSQALATFVTINGVSTINDTKTFSSSPIVPNATLNNHAVNLGQVESMLNNTNQITQVDLFVLPIFQDLINSYPSVEIKHAIAYFRGKTLGVSIAIGNSDTSVDVTILNASIGYNMFEFPLEIMERLNNEIVELVPNLKLNNDDFIHGLNNGTSFITFSDGRVNHTGNLVVKRNSKLILTAEFECLNE